MDNATKRQTAADEKAAAEIQEMVYHGLRSKPRAGFTTNKNRGVPKTKRRMAKLSRRRNRPKRKRAA